MRTFLILLLILGSDISFSQVLIPKSIDPEMQGYKTSNFVQISVMGGFLVPLGDYLKENFDSSPIIGAEISYRVNKETALYLETKYDIMSFKDTLGPSAGYLEATVGARFYWRHRCYRSSFFIEAGIGPYIYFQGSATTPFKQYTSETTFRLGANAGAGGEIVITNSLFFILKAKINSIFLPVGSTTFVSGTGGLSLRL